MKWPTYDTSISPFVQGEGMSNKQEATWHDGKKCPGTPHRGHTRMAVTEDPAFGVSIPWEPQPRPGQPVSELGIDEWVGQALGAASSCWSNLPEAGVFDSTRCKAIIEALMAHINGLFSAFVKEAEARRDVSDKYLRSLLEESEPRLGLATTRALLQEIEVRFQVTTPHPDAEDIAAMLKYLPDSILDYRTVDGV